MRTVQADAGFEISDNEWENAVLSWTDDARPWVSSAFVRRAARELAKTEALPDGWHATHVLRRFAEGGEVLASDLRHAVRKAGEQFGSDAFLRIEAERETIGERLLGGADLGEALDHNHRGALFAVILLDWVENEVGPWSDLGPWRG
ncbi:hypothetical protein [Segniliparus rugosus]|uniref:Uncharacterized protein n=1 Tax=Segniliparus rugosus (strain ATCC BAA-974 / DSM 45345 / CCUG 50838 / CIP 108380 / JCM 13579 / CDC 945) TaxID=679197 RepID=E5XMU3_SEGRC|nr:hypothetical protein [Segniliparus rugosus]EFV14363.1 hypothetical protein HMPREF9336_00813 [Segniliparus rugosus ATCC BAA-974]